VPTPTGSCRYCPRTSEADRVEVHVGGEVGNGLGHGEFEVPAGEVGFCVRRYSPILVSLIKVGEIV